MNGQQGSPVTWEHVGVVAAILVAVLMAAAWGTTALIVTGSVLQVTAWVAIIRRLRRPR